MHHPRTDIQADFEINRPLDIKVPRKKNIDTDGQTDRRTDRQTDRWIDGRTDVAYDNNRYFFIEERKKLLIIRRSHNCYAGDARTKSTTPDVLYRMLYIGCTTSDVFHMDVLHRMHCIGYNDNDNVVIRYYNKKIKCL